MADEYFGGYKDKSRSLELATSIIDLRVKDRPIAATNRLSTSPSDAAFVDVGEWLCVNADGELYRLACTAGASPANVTLAGHSDMGVPKLVWSERGAKDIQMLDKIPVIEGAKRAFRIKTYMWAATTAITMGDELCVTFTNGSDWTADGSNFTGLKGIVTRAVSANFATGAYGGVTYDGGATGWIVGLARNTVDAAGELLEMDVYPVPIRKVIRP